MRDHRDRSSDDGRHTVVVISQNDENLLRRAVDSLLQQSLLPEVVIAVGGQESDACSGIARSYAEAYDFIHVTRIARGHGALAAIGATLQMVATEFVSILSDEDTYRPEFSRWARQVFALNPSASVCACQVEWVDKDGAPEFQPAPILRGDADRLLTPPEVLALLLRHRGVLNVAGCVFRTTALREIGGFQADLNQFSFDFANQYLALRDGVCYTPAKLATSRQAGVSLEKRLAADPEAAVLAYRALKDRVTGGSADIFPEPYRSRLLQRALYRTLRAAMDGGAPGAAVALDELARQRPILGSTARLVVGVLGRWSLGPLLVLMLRMRDVPNAVDRRVRAMLASAAPRRGSGRLKAALLAVKITISVAVLWLTFQNLDLGNVALMLWSGEGGVSLVAAALASVATILASGLKLRSAAQCYDKKIELGGAIAINFVGTLFSQVLMTFVSGDVIRVWALCRLGAGVRDGIAIIILDRIMGLLILVGFMLVGLYWFEGLVEAEVAKLTVYALALGGASAIVAFALAGYAPEAWRRAPYIGYVIEIAAMSGKLRARPWAAGRMLMWSASVAFMNVMSVYMICMIQGVALNFWWSFVLFPPILLLSMLPISFSGWGVRESAMAVGMGLVGVSSEAAVAVSVTFGLGLALSSLVGLALLPQMVADRGRGTVL